MKITKAILTGGGRATRLWPITTTTNKHLLPLANKPMIFHAIEKVVEGGVREIFINTNPGEKELQACVGDGSRWGVKITFFEQTGGPQGIAHVVKLAQPFIGDDPFIFYLSDNIVAGRLTDLFSKFETGRYDCMLAFAEVPDPERFGVPIFNQAKELIDVVEKPINPPNKFAVTGIYFYGSGVFFDTFDRIEKSPRGEYEISSIHSRLLKEGGRVGYEEVTGWWKDTGKPDDLLLANKLLLDHTPDEQFLRHSPDGGAKTIGLVHIGKDSTIGKDSIIRGPVLIGENCSLEHATIGPYVTIGDNSTISDAIIQNSIILPGARLHGIFSLADSLIGKDVSIKKNKLPSGRPIKLIVGDRTAIEF